MKKDGNKMAENILHSQLLMTGQSKRYKILLHINIILSYIK